eukprot:12224516-Prorocentrum_lima.AAC.1
MQKRRRKVTSAAKSQATATYFVQPAQPVIVVAAFPYVLPSPLSWGRGALVQCPCRLRQHRVRSNCHLV